MPRLGVLVVKENKPCAAGGGDGGAAHPVVDKVEAYSVNKPPSDREDGLVQSNRSTV